MANFVHRNQLLEQVPSGQQDGNVSTGRHAMFATAYFEDEPVGGLQSINIRESNGTRFIPQIGNDYLEPVYGMRQWSGDAQRFSIRGRSMQQIMLQMFSKNDPQPLDLDWRQIPFDIRLHFDFRGLTNVRNDDAWWVLHTVFITDYSLSFPDANNIQMENVTFISKGLQSWDSSGTSIYNYPGLWGHERETFFQFEQTAKAASNL